MKFIKAKDPGKFRLILDALKEGYGVDLWPGSRSAAFQAELISLPEARRIEKAIFSEMEEIDWDETEFVSFRLRGEKKWRFITDSNDFPQPSEEES
jgi:hypothetical protein